jgi:hypothetical protein
MEIVSGPSGMLIAPGMKPSSIGRPDLSQTSSRALSLPESP